ncbi:MAG TPA: lysylphosphatidylglycerol synthase domain-containing protein [Gaiellaceae bacterium]|nr:lysylphosphatidylglycerol synthase domain-containing protein [Gaiellaceae bacterium]
MSALRPFNQAMGASLRHLRRAIASSYLEQHPAHTLAFVVIAGTLAVGALAGVVFVAGPEAVAHRLAHPRLYWLPIAFGATIVSYLGYIFAYRECACAGEGVDLPLHHVGALVAGGFGLFIPRGGFALDVEALELAGLPRREARVRTLSLGTLEYAVLAPVAFAISLLLLTRGFHRVGVPLSWAIGVPAGAAVALWLMRRRRGFALRGGWRSRLAHALDGIAQTVRLVQNRRAGALALLGMTLYWAADIFVLWACLAVFWPDGHPSVEVIILGYASGYALTRRSLPLAGAGAVETMLPFTLMWTGIALPAAVLCVFAYRLFNLWMPLVPAAAAVFLLRRTAGPAGAHG